jgi:hypothetical protein
MALTTDLINSASPHLGEKEIQLWLILIRKLPRYQLYSAAYAGEVQTRLEAAEGTIKARILNALMGEINELGTGEASIQGDREGLHWSQSQERMALIEEAFDVLFADHSELIVPYNPSGSVYNGLVATGTRRIGCEVCPVCGRTRSGRSCLCNGY